MTERREIKQRSPAVWARVREAYLAGEPAASVARRFDVGLGNLRYRANAEGWTRKAMMAATATEEGAENIRLAGRAGPIRPAPAEAPINIDPEEASAAGIRHAAALIAAGRGVEALNLLKAVQGLAQTLEATARPYDAEPEPDRFDYKALQTHSFEMAVKNAEAMLGDTGSGVTSAFGHAAYHWRAANRGPEIARHDFEQGVSGGWASRYWDEHGRLHPLEPPPAPGADDAPARRPDARRLPRRDRHERDRMDADLGEGKDEEARQPVGPPDIEPGPRVRRL